jgi:type IV secretory pathway VirB9-like protein
MENVIWENNHKKELEDFVKPYQKRPKTFMIVHRKRLLSPSRHFIIRNKNYMLKFRKGWKYDYVIVEHYIGVAMAQKNISNDNKDVECRIL